MNQLLKNISQRAIDIYENIIEYRRHIHSNPELSFEEYKTTEFICSLLDKWGIEYNRPILTGVVAQVGSGNRCIALRADIDALPIEESTGLDYSSINNGVMHACGHDMHTAMLLGALKIIKEHESKLKGTVKFIFQPGEEKIPGGASILIDKGVLNNPDVEAVFGQHVNPGAETGLISILPGPIMGSADELYWTISGKGAHAAQPHIGNDAILASANIITYVQSLISKYKNPVDAGLISITSVHGGTAPNIFPDEVKMMGTMRSFDNKWREGILTLLTERSDKIASLYDCHCKVEIRKGYPPLINNDKTTGFITELATDIFGNKKVEKFEPKMWAEDFAYFALKVPSTFWFLGVRPKNVSEIPALHNAGFAPDEEALKSGITMLASIPFNYFD